MIELKETDGRQDNNQHQKTQLEGGEEDVRADDGYGGGEVILFVVCLKQPACVCEWLLFFWFIVKSVL